MSLIRRERRQFQPEPFVPPFPDYDPKRGGPPTVARAMQVSAVWACVRLIADSVSMMPLQSFTINSSGYRVPIAPPSFVQSPSADATMNEWVYMALVSLLLRGNAYGRIVNADSYGYPKQIELVNPDSVRVQPNANGGLVYVINGVEFPAKSVLHMRAFRMPGSRLGLSPIEYAATQINTDSAISDFAYGYFRDGAHPSSVLTTDSTLTQDQAKTAKDRFVSAIKGREPALLSGGFKYQQIQVNPNESQFLQTQQAGVTDIARMFGVPPEMIGGTASNSMTYANVEQRGLDFLTYTVQPWLTRLESMFAGMFPGPRHLKFDTTALTRTDYETTIKSTAIGIASKQMTPDEARALRDEPPLTADQKALLALVPLDVGPTGSPKPLPPAASTEGEPA